MIDAASFLTETQSQGFDFFTGVPCSFLTPLINQVLWDHGVAYIPATSEGEAVALAAGAWLAGRKAVVMAQNSGLGNMVNPLTSLTWPFKIPLLLIVTWRGQPGLKDEPQHELMGQITHTLLETLNIPYWPFPPSVAVLRDVVDTLSQKMKQSSLPVALVMEGGGVSGHESAPRSLFSSNKLGRSLDMCVGGDLPSRVCLLETVLEWISPDTGVIATTGKCGRELFTLADRDQHFYLVGAMGCASALALGVALNTSRPVVVLDGDGAALMKMGNLATIGAHQPQNLLHVILDNGVHDSTGGQATVSASVSFTGVAIACGYQTATLVDTVGAFKEALRSTSHSPGPHLIHARISAGSLEKLGRPTIAPSEVAQRFRSFLKDKSVP